MLASIQAIILVTIYRKYSTNYLLSIFLFIASTDYLSWMFNGVRQFAAVTIIFASTKFMLEKKVGSYYFDDFTCVYNASISVSDDTYCDNCAR